MAASQADFINEKLIFTLLEKAQGVPLAETARILEKAAFAKGLTPWEVAVLLQADDNQVLDQIFHIANQIKEAIYGKRLVFFAPLYISDFCVNNCQYCGYRHDNHFSRRRLSLTEIKQEVLVLEGMGHKRLALECGEDDQHCPLEYVLEALATIYAVKAQHGSIRRVNVNIAATTVENYRKLAEAKIGTYILFQETYHRATYHQMHPSGPKADYAWHTCAMDRAMAGGIDDVGMGVLFGLHDYKFEVLGLLFHALHLEDVYGVGPHTISVPRLRPAQGISLENFPHLVTDAEFKKLIAILRLAVPYTGLIISTRETAVFRQELLAVGISQLSAASCTGVGGYQQEKACTSAGQAECIGEQIDTTTERHSCLGQEQSRSEKVAPQFQVEDQRSLDEVVSSICQAGHLPSFCTACYRRGRTGDRFMELAKRGQIQHVCQPNALLTFKEFLLDYASLATRQIGEQTIARHLELVSNPAIRQEAERRLEQVEQGARDLYF